MLTFMRICAFATSEERLIDPYSGTHAPQNILQPPAEFLDNFSSELTTWNNGLLIRGSL